MLILSDLIRIYTMIKLPDFRKSFSYENDFYLSCDNSRLGKFIAHYELFKQIVGKSGVIVECGVFKGTSLVRFAGFRQLLDRKQGRQIVAFDTFNEFPATNFAPDKKLRDKLIADAGSQSISIAQLTEILRRKRSEAGVELVAGDINQTVPEYVRRHPKLQIALLNIDVDIYEPTVTILKHLYPLVVSGGIVMLDDYGVFPGETKAVDEYFKSKAKIRSLSYSKTPRYIVKS